MNTLQPSKNKILFSFSLLLLLGLVIPPHSSAQEEGNLHVFLPLITNYESVATSTPTAASPLPTPDLRTPQDVFALLGTVEHATGQRFDNFFATQDGLRFALLGQTPIIEQQITDLRNNQPNTPLKVWGTLFPKDEATPYIKLVVNAIQIATDDDVIPATPTPTPDTRPPRATGRFNMVNLRVAPTTQSQRQGAITSGQICVIAGRDANASWWLLACENGAQGWIQMQLVIATGNTDTVEVVAADTIVAPPTIVPTVMPTLTPVPQNFRFWKTSYFSNRSLLGPPDSYADLAEINFNWDNGSPAAGVGVDNFSIRFERTILFTSGYYRFTVQADDGVRVWLDEELVLDEWHGSMGQEYVFGRNLAGSHALRVEYYEAGGIASIQFRYDSFRESPDWTASYFDNVDLAGASVLVRQEPATQIPLDYNWRFAAPASVSVGNDLWSARWTGRFQFENGNYIFRTRSDDGVRVYLNDLLVIDKWRDGYRDMENEVIAIRADRHTITVEYYERYGSAELEVWWYKDETQQFAP